MNPLLLEELKYFSQIWQSTLENFSQSFSSISSHFIKNIIFHKSNNKLKITIFLGNSYFIMGLQIKYPISQNCDCIQGLPALNEFMTNHPDMSVSPSKDEKSYLQSFWQVMIGHKPFELPSFEEELVSSFQEGSSSFLFTLAAFLF